MSTVRHAPPSRRQVIAAAGAAALAGATASTVAGCADGSPDAQPLASGTPSTSSPATTATGSTSTTSGTTPPGTTAPAGTTAPGTGPAAGPDITHGTSGRPEVALTFHGAGDGTLLRRMLAQFAEAGAHVTVLAIGTWLAEQPAAARLVLDGGHDLGNHTWSHQTMPRLDPARITTEVRRAADELRRLTGSAGRWFRPSGTPSSTPAIRAAAVAAGYGACLGYGVDPLDYTDPGPDAIERAFRSGVRAGSIVSLHLGHPGTLTAMPRLLADLHDRGLTAVTATRLLGNA